MDNQPFQPSKAELDSKTAHDNAVRAGEKLADAEIKLQKAEELMLEANIRLSNARKFEKVLKERQKKLDRAFILLNKERGAIKQRQLRADQHDLMLEQNTQQF